MSVKLGRYIFRRIGGKIIPIRVGTNLPVKPSLAPPQKIAQHFKVGKMFEADFHLQRKGSANTVGTIRKGFENEDIGIKVKDTTKILPDFAKYAFMNLKNNGLWGSKANGSLALKNLKSSDVAKTSIEELFPSMKSQRANAEAAIKKLPSGVSSKALKRMNLLVKGGQAEIKGGKLRDPSGVSSSEKLDDFLHKTGAVRFSHHDDATIVQLQKNLSSEQNKVLKKLAERPLYAEITDRKKQTFSKEFEGFSHLNNDPIQNKLRIHRETKIGNKLEERAIKELGVTHDPAEAGFIMRDGTMIDLSGKREGGISGVRHMDHREVSGFSGLKSMGKKMTNRQISYAMQSAQRRRKLNNRK